MEATIAVWAGVVAELLVAAVIYLELKAGRISRALEAVYDRDRFIRRRRLYEVFLSISVSGDLKQQPLLFLDKIKQDERLWQDCEAQVTHFIRLGYILRQHIPFRPYGPREVVESISHVMVPLAFMLSPYIALRRKHKGRHYAKHFIGLAAACIPHVYSNGIVLFQRSLQDKPFRLDEPQLRALRDELRLLIKH